MVKDDLTDVRDRYYRQGTPSPGWTKHTASIDSVILELGLLIKLNTKETSK